jgi:hypothetical protein
LRWNWNIVTPHNVFGFVPDPNLLQRLWYIDGARDWLARYLEQYVAGADACIVALAAGSDMQGEYLILTIGSHSVYPRNSIIRKMIQALLMEIDDGAAHRRYCEYKQQRASELGFKIPQAAVSAETP